MKYIKPENGPTALLPYLLGGLAVALGDLFVRSATWRLFRNEALGTWFDLTVTLPVLLMLLAVAYPCIRAAIFGTTLATAMFAFIGDFALLHAPAIHILGGKIGGIPAAIALAWPLYLALSVGMVLFVRRWRRIGAPPAGQCAACGYSLYGLTEPRCPECGTTFAGINREDIKNIKDFE